MLYGSAASPAIAGALWHRYTPCISLQVLLVEDEAGLADFVVRGLSEEGYAVTCAADGVAGWMELQSRIWDLVLLDWWLPGEDGLSLLRRFRMRDRATPVIFLTARDAIPERVEGLNAGADDYLCKPFAFEELLARIRAALRRQDQAAELKLQFRDIVADAAAQRVTRAGHPLDLTAKEFSLLLLFLRRPGTGSKSEGECIDLVGRLEADDAGICEWIGPCA